MSELLEKLTSRFDATNIEQVTTESENSIQLVLIKGITENNRNLQVLTTIGLSNYKMPVDDAHLAYQYIELCFALPSYWDVNDSTNPNFNWVNHWLIRLSNYLVEKKTWFGHGHTIATASPPIELSQTMKQTYFMFADPIALAKNLTTMQIGDTDVRFLFVIPLFKDEFEHKVARGTFSLLNKFKQKNYAEILDDYRTSSVRKKYLLF